MNTSHQNTMKILIVDDEEIQRVSLQDDLNDAGYKTLAVESPIVALELAAKEEIDVVITDLKMPAMDGISFMQELKKIQPGASIIMMTAYATVETAVEAMKIGAYDYLTKPFNTEELLLLLQRIDDFRSVMAENVQLRKQLQNRYNFGNIIGKSAAMQQVYQQLETVAGTETTVLIEGKTGTGKEMVANAIHYSSPRKDKPFVKVSCAVLSKEILESELFGHERGAFTGALRQKKGRFELADGGSIFLDEVDDIPVELQVKLLRVLEEKTFERVGGTETLKVDVRVIAATKKDLRQLVEEGQFREDLYYRLNIYPIKLPTLKERQEDIQLLFEHFLDKLSPGAAPVIDPAVYRFLLDYEWPGNVREFKNFVERLTLSCKCDPVVPECLPPEIRSADVQFKVADEQSLDERVATFEKRLILHALSQTDGNKAKAAETLHIPVSTLKSKIKKYNISWR